MNALLGCIVLCYLVDGKIAVLLCGNLIKMHCTVHAAMGWLWTAKYTTTVRVLTAYTCNACYTPLMSL